MTNKKRLDEYLIDMGLATESEIRIALNHQKVYGGKFGSHLLHHGFISEDDLIRALASQFDSNGVVLSRLSIPSDVIKMIPADFSYSRLAIPFDRDESTKVVMVACEDPSDQELLNEIEFLVKGWTVKLYVAAELSLINALEKYYDDIPAELASQRVSVDHPDSSGTNSENNETAELKTRTILLVSDDQQLSPFVKLMLEQDGFLVSVVDSADDAFELVDQSSFEAVFIKDTVPGDYLDLIDRLRKNSPSTKVRYYESAASLLLDDLAMEQQGNLLFHNLELFTSLLSIKDHHPTNHAGRVGQYVNKLCRRLGLPHKERMFVTNAAYVHDLFKFYDPGEDNRDFRSVVKRTAQMLQSIGYEPVVVEMLNRMYKDLKHKYTKRLPIEALGGNILTMVDLFCDGMVADERLTLDRFEPIKIKLQSMVGTLFLPEVAEAFVGMIEEEIMSFAKNHRYCQVMIFSDRPEAAYPLTLRLKTEGFRIIGAGSEQSLIQLYERSRPDIIIIQVASSPNDVLRMLERFHIAGVDFGHTPAFLLVNSENIPQLTNLMEKGIEDIIDRESPLDFLTLKVKKIRSQLEEKADSTANNSGYSGAKGNLADLNMIDLLQALGPGRRSMRMSVFSNGDQLEIYLDRGTIIYAKLGDLVGPDAIYRAMLWDEGSWEVTPVKLNQMPEPNNELSNESILMEGCRLMDEAGRQSDSVFDPS